MAATADTTITRPAQPCFQAVPWGLHHANRPTDLGWGNWLSEMRSHTPCPKALSPNMHMDCSWGRSTHNSQAASSSAELPSICAHELACACTGSPAHAGTCWGQAADHQSSPSTSRLHNTSSCRAAGIRPLHRRYSKSGTAPLHQCPSQEQTALVYQGRALEPHCVLTSPENPCLCDGTPM